MNTDLTFWRTQPTVLDQPPVPFFLLKEHFAWMSSTKTSSRGTNYSHHQKKKPQKLPRWEEMHKKIVWPTTWPAHRPSSDFGFPKKAEKVRWWLLNERFLLVGLFLFFSFVKPFLFTNHSIDESLIWSLRCESISMSNNLFYLTPNEN